MTTRHKVRISDIGQVFDGPHATPKTIDEGPLFLGITSLNAGRLDLSNTRHVSEDDFAKWTKRVQPMAGDVVFSYETKIGEAALIPTGLKCCLGRRMGLVRLDQTKCDPRYFLYQYLSPEYQQFLASRTVHGATVDRLLLKDFPSFEFPLPPLPEQRDIAAILGAIDDKIELNRKTAATLEAMARALYRSWFVDFDPVWAKTEGRTPAHMDEATAALIPDSFGDDGLPVGWRRGKLGDVARNPREGTDPATIDQETPYIGLEHVPRKSIAIAEWGTADDVGSTKSRMAVGQFLFGKLRPYFHKVGLVPIDGICSTDILVVEAIADQWRELVLSVISSADLVDHVNAASTGTKMPRAKWRDLADYEIAIAPDLAVRAYSQIVRPMHNRILKSIHENQELATLRDTLLPKLMSGELRVREAQELVEEVA